MPLREPGTDWTKSADEKRFYVTLSKSGKVAVIDTETFKLLPRWTPGRAPSVLRSSRTASSSGWGTTRRRGRRAA